MGAKRLMDQQKTRQTGRPRRDGMVQTEKWADV